METNIPNLHLEAAENADLKTMSPEELVAELARLQRSQSGNPVEEPWSDELFARSKEVEKLIKNPRPETSEYPDLEAMSPEEIIAERARLQRSQSGNPVEEPWNNELFARSKEVEIIFQRNKG